MKPTASFASVGRQPKVRFCARLREREEFSFHSELRCPLLLQSSGKIKRGSSKLRIAISVRSTLRPRRGTKREGKESGSVVGLCRYGRGSLHSKWARVKWSESLVLHFLSPCVGLDFLSRSFESKYRNRNMTTPISRTSQLLLFAPLSLSTTITRPCVPTFLS